MASSLSILPDDALAEGVISLSIRGETVTAEVAETDSEVERGLMGRERLGPDSGMLFVLPHPTTMCMWMKDTAIPLSVAFITVWGTVSSIEDMEPLTLDYHCSKGGVPYALEMERGWFRKKRIKQGDQIRGLPPISHVPGRD